MNSKNKLVKASAIPYNSTTEMTRSIIVLIEQAKNRGVNKMENRHENDI